MSTTTAPSLTLTADQEAAYQAFVQFYLDPEETVFVLAGYSGTGKSTLVSYLLEHIPKIEDMVRLVNPSAKKREVIFTATTNKAAENFQRITGEQVTTIHSRLGLRVKTDYKTGTTTLVPQKRSQMLYNAIVFIDEASYVDRQLLQLIFDGMSNCKIVFIGDPAQLTPVKSNHTPVFDAKFPGAHLSQVVRQAKGNPIIDLATRFRETVNSGEFFSFSPDGNHIQYLERDAFEQAIAAEFTRPDWKFLDSKVLAWTNRCVIDYNHRIRDMAKGDPRFQAGDYAVCNKYLNLGKDSIKTDQMVHISDISEEVVHHGVRGYWYELGYSTEVFGPKHLEDKKAFIKQAQQNQEYDKVLMADAQWIDLRAAYACTINKSQGSTFDRVFIDLSDVSRCNSGDQIARMLYVAVSRAREQVFLTGDLV